jgi:hypothetical protein
LIAGISFMLGMMGMVAGFRPSHLILPVGLGIAVPLGLPIVTSGITAVIM